MGITQLLVTEHFKITVFTWILDDPDYKMIPAPIIIRFHI